ncbi:MAG: D-Ala-D-Ala carboxypeptidase family metallohydrolase [Verrucomicrobiales bacterium]|nr:D-Ala-D-Ala carboxypeptidase family metallohydrolase [Verrucomicrobiota bacterium JB025]
MIGSLPSDWANRNGASADEYFRYLSRLGLRRVDAAQVVAAHAKKKGSVWNAIPPKQWWKRMGYTLKIVERVAMEMNVSQVEVVSAYRSPSYNARCAGAKPGSWHKANAAVDVKFPVKASKVTATARELRNLGLFKGGVGGYWSFTHIDCRGKNVDW